MSHDPLSVLSHGDLPVQPDPEFAARLRRRLESALSLPPGAERLVMSDTDTVIEDLLQFAQNEPAPFLVPGPVVAYLAVADARRALQWYADALGAVVIGEPIVMDDNRIGHAELAIGSGILYLADEFPELGLRAPAPDAVSVSLMLPVADTDAALARAREQGANVVREADEGHGSLGATIIDPFGHRWMLSGPMIGAIAPIRHGGVGYVSVWTPNADKAAAFYGQVLGWVYDPALREVISTSLPTGLFTVKTVADGGTLFCSYAVADLVGARATILEAGGTVDEPQTFSFGTVLGATDTEGTAFAVYEPSSDTTRPELNGAGPGELSYITYEVGDSTAFREFYGPLLHWTFEQGRVDDGWQITPSHPMGGVAGGSARPSTVPM